MRSPSQCLMGNPCWVELTKSQGTDLQNHGHGLGICLHGFTHPGFVFFLPCDPRGASYISATVYLTIVSLLGFLGTLAFIHMRHRFSYSFAGPYWIMRIRKDLEVGLCNVDWKISRYMPFTCVYTALHHWAWHASVSWIPEKVDRGFDTEHFKM